MRDTCPEGTLAIVTPRGMILFALALLASGAACLGRRSPGIPTPSAPATAAAVADAGGTESRGVGEAGLAVGLAHACAIFAGGQVACWGANDHGQLGLGTVSSSEPPEWVPGLSDVVELAAGASSTCARRADGTVWCWGANTSGQLGDGTLADRPEARPVAGLVGVVSLTSAGDDVCVLQRAGGTSATSCWGSDPGAPFGSAHVDRRRPAEVALPLEPVGIAVGPASECAWAADGRIACRGERTILVHGTQGFTIVPEAVVVQSVAGTVAMGFGADRSCAVRKDGAVSCWGLRLTEPRSLTLDETATEVAGVGDVAEVAGGSDFMLARRRDGDLITWGRSDPLGGAPAPPSFGPRMVAGLTGIARIGLGGLFCAREHGGKIVCSGREGGLLGDGTLDEGPLSLHEVLAPGAMDHARWVNIQADGEGDACQSPADCEWDDACAPTRCQGKVARAPSPACSAAPVNSGECTCTSHHCMLRPKLPPPPPAGSCARLVCGLDQAAGQCVLGSGQRGNRHPGPDGPRCTCDRGTDRCTFVWREAASCREDADCRPPSLRKRPFRPCVDGDAAPKCIEGKCGFGRPYPC